MTTMLVPGAAPQPLSESYWPADPTDPVLEATVGDVLRRAAAEAGDAYSHGQSAYSSLFVTQMKPWMSMRSRGRQVTSARSSRCTSSSMAA